jgi:uncharacterized protein YgiM (DUF1202 family)
VITVATAAHQGPSADSTVAFELGSGKIVAAMVRAGEWIQVRDDQGRTGWVAASNTLEIE